jgi:hypothetical protein
MRVKILKGPAAGQIRHAEKSQATQLLIDAGLAELVVEAPPAPPKVTWAVHTGTTTQRLFIAASCSNPLCGTFKYEGSAANAPKQKFLHSCGAYAPEAVPPAVVSRYAASKREEQPVVGDDEGIYWKMFHNKAGDNMHRPVDHGVDYTKTASEVLGVVARPLK